jgi:thiamine-phosphate pyrophosphorylase
MERAAYRIIDANFNRAREAIRVIEDYCRFALNSTWLNLRAKELRHKLTRAVGKLDSGRLISSRDTLNDVGVGKNIDNQLSRSDLKDCFTAGCKRLTEALRALAEIAQIHDKSTAKTIEDLRYDAYTLEKDIFIFAEPAEKFKKVLLYVVITSDLPGEIISLTYKCATSGADCIQMRAKSIEDDKLLATAVEFVRINNDEGVLSVINDRIDVAIAAGADGVHLGQNDLPLDCVRKLQTTPLITGKSTHSPDQLRAACQERPTYVGLGPVFTTGTKPTAEAVGLEYIRQAKGMLDGTGVGHVAIGGITLENIGDVLDAGAESIAVCAAVTKVADPGNACKAMKAKIVAERDALGV